jgi:ABC-type glutathione transport system ATPase component/ABC-type dipeptide/oligopeptide/nickel transport system permease subunit
MKRKHAFFSILFIIVIFLFCFVSPAVTGIDPNAQDLAIRNASPSMSHWFGTDSLGRDIFARVCVGGRTSLTIALICTVLTLLIGCLYGGICAFFDRADCLMMAFLYVVSSIPDILLVLIISALICPNRAGIFPVVISITASGWCKTARLTRDLLRPLRDSNYVLEAKTLKKNGFYNIIHHMLPNISYGLITRALLSVPEFIFYESFLSYLGIGVNPPDTSWGSLISSAQTNFMFHPYQLVFSSLFLIVWQFSLTWLGSFVCEENLAKDTWTQREGDLSPQDPSSSHTELFACGNILSVQNLSVQYEACEDWAVRNVSFAIHKGEIVGLVGKSGCGKTSIARAISGMLPFVGGYVSPETKIMFDDILVDFSNAGLRKIRGRHGVAVIYQDAVSSLDPTMKIGKQLQECLSLREELSKEAQKNEIEKYLCDVGLDTNVDELLSLYPHQLSGGIAQRIIIAMAIMAEPKLLICDEPTASLDFINKKRIAELIKRVAKAHNTAVLFISHDIGLVTEIASKIIVMSDGELKEASTPPEMKKTMKNHTDATNELIQAAVAIPKERHDFHTEKTVLIVEHIACRYPKASADAINDVSFKLKRGEVLGVLGESGSGKTTLARAILGQIRIKHGCIHMDPSITTQQYLFQNPISAFDPHWTIGKSILEGVPRENANREQLEHLLQQVGLNPLYANRYPHELSQGQCQRAAIARAISVNPQLLICDEPTSSLDLVNQKQILELLIRMNAENHLTYIFISHDLDVIRYVSDRIVVMLKGAIIEVASTTELFEHAVHPYSKLLLDKEKIRADEESIKKTDGEQGCKFFDCCLIHREICREKRPDLRRLGNDTEIKRHHFVACHAVEYEEFGGGSLCQ